VTSLHLPSCHTLLARQSRSTKHFPHAFIINSYLAAKSIRSAKLQTVSRHPALVQAFAGVAEAKQRLEGALEGVVKVTAYEHMDGFDKSGDQTRVEMLFFPEGNNPLPQTKP
jgi:hypothetical protein